MIWPVSGQLNTSETGSSSSNLLQTDTLLWVYPQVNSLPFTVFLAVAVFVISLALIRLDSGFVSGSTPYGCYQKLIEFHRSGDLSFKYVKTFNMDEYVGECNLLRLAEHNH